MLAVMLDVEGFILVGGASSRMGRDKSRLVLGKQTVVERITLALSQVVTNVRIVGSRMNGFSSVADVHKHWGPLGGIHAALLAATTEWSLIVACDLPFVTHDLFDRLIQFCDESNEAVVPVQDDSRPQPLCALYRRSCLTAAEVSIAKGEHSPRALLDKVATRYVEFSELSDLAGSEHFFLNVNTPENYELAVKLAQRELTQQSPTVQESEGF